MIDSESEDPLTVIQSTEKRRYRPVDDWMPDDVESYRILIRDGAEEFIRNPNTHMVIGYRRLNPP